MDYTHLGRSGVAVCRVCLGTMNFGEVTDEAEGHRIMDEAILERLDKVFPGPGDPRRKPRRGSRRRELMIGSEPT